MPYNLALRLRCLAYARNYAMLKNSGLGSSVESYSGASSNGSLAPRRFIWFFLLVLIGDYAGAGYC